MVPLHTPPPHTLPHHTPQSHHFPHPHITSLLSPHTSPPHTLTRPSPHSTPSTHTCTPLPHPHKPTPHPHMPLPTPSHAPPHTLTCPSPHPHMPTPHITSVVIICSSCRASASPQTYGDLELFLLGLQLRELIAVFKSHNVTFSGLLSLTEQDLEKVRSLMFGPWLAANLGALPPPTQMFEDGCGAGGHPE